MSPRFASALRHGLKAATLVAAAALVFAPAIRGTWLWDDPSAVAENPVLRDPAGLAKIWSGRAGQDFFPLTTTVQWLQWHLWQGDVAGYHLTNLGLHILSAVLLWGLLAKLGVRLAFLGGLLFAVHPLAVESVAWISELKNTLSLPLLLLAAIAWIECDRNRGLGILPKSSRGHGLEARATAKVARASRLPSLRLQARTPALLFFTAAMLAKTSVVMFPAVLLLHAWWRRGRIGRRDLAATAPFFAVSLILGLVTIHFQSARAMAHLPLPATGLASRLALAGPAALFYLAQAILPVHLLPIYPAWNLDGLVPWAVLAWTALGAGLAWCWTRRASWGRHALLGFGWFFLNLIPVLGIVPMAYLRISRVSDHFAYLPLIGLAGLVAAGAAKAEGEIRKSGRLGLFPLFAFRFSLFLLLAALAIMSRGYARIFTSEESLWTYTLQHNPGAWLAHNNLGIVLARSGRLDDAIGQAEEAVRLEPDFPEARSNLGLDLTEAGRYPEAIAQLEAAVRLRPDLPGAHLNLGRALLAAGRGRDAVAQFAQVLALQPDNPAARRNLAIAHNNLGNALARAGRLAEAVAEFEQSLQLDPANRGTHRNLGYALQALGRDREAAAQFDAAGR
jgi:tetratricopeptide (TPR) repeat protein